MATPGFYNEQDQNIYDNVSKFMPQSKYLLSAPTFTAPTTEEEKVTETFGIPNTNAFTNSGGGGGYYPGSPNTLIGNFNSIVDARQKRLNNPSDTFLGFNTMKDQEMTTMGKIRDFFTPQSASQIMSDGYREPRFQPGIIATIMGKLDNFRNLPQADQAFIAQNMGYTGPTVFGENNSGLSKDIYGINTRSMFGNYANYVDKAARSDMTDEEYAALTDFNKRKVDFYREQKKESETLRMQEELAKEERERDLATLNQRMQDTGVTGKNYNQEANLAGGGGGDTATYKGQTAREATYDNDPNTGTAQSYSQHYAKGGLASIL